MSESALLEIEDLHVEFGQGEGRIRAVQGVDLDIRPGEAVGVVGESGSGKSVSMLAALGLLEARRLTVSGQARFRDRDLLTLPASELRRIRGAEIAMIFQDPLSSLNPVLTIERQMVEALVIHRGMGGSAARARAVELLELVGIPDARRRLRQHPHQFSGGMRQRVMIAAALMCEPALLIADEPTTALDVTIQAQILDLLADLRRELGMALLLITHDLGVVAGVVDRVNVMYAGRVVEQGPVAEVLADPRHPYTRGLLRSIPRLDRPSARLEPVRGGPPDLGAEIAGCPFRPRCPFAFDRCAERPALLRAGEERRSACWLVHDRLPLPA